MKPNADMITKILSDLRVNGKVAQDRLLIGKGSDEVLTFGSGNLKVRYTPQVTGGRTFTVLGSSDHDVYDEVVILKPYPKPSNSFSEQWILPASDTIWISDNLQDPNYSSWRLIMFVGRTNAASGNVPTRWALKTVVNGSGAYGIDWATSNVQDFLGVDTNITWSNGEASSYPTSVNDWSTDGAQAKQPEQFSMSNVEGSIQKLEYTTDGSTWHTLGEASNGATVVYEPIEFDQSYLSSDGKITIQHNFNDKNVLCLGYTPQPKEITYLDNEIVLDYSDQNSSNLSGAVWFVNSKQEMLVVPVAPEILTVTGAGSSDVNGTYNLVAESEWSSCISDEDLAGVTSGSAYLNENRDHVLFDKTTAASRTITFMTHKDLGSNPLYRADDVTSGDATTVTFTVVNGASPAPTVTVGEGVTDPEEPPDNVVVTSPIYVSGSHPTQVNCDGTYETYDGSAASTAAPSGSTTVAVYFTMDGGFQITIIQNNTSGEVTFYLMDVSSQMDDAVVYFVGHPSDTSTNHYDPTQAVWSLGQYGTDPIPTISLEQPVKTGSFDVAGAGTAGVDGIYYEVPHDQYLNYIPSYLPIDEVYRIYTNGTYMLLVYVYSTSGPQYKFGILNNGGDWYMEELYTSRSWFTHLDAISVVGTSTVNGTAPAPTVTQINTASEV